MKYQAGLLACFLTLPALTQQKYRPSINDELGFIPPTYVWAKPNPEDLALPRIYDQKWYKGEFGDIIIDGKCNSLNATHQQSVVSMYVPCLTPSESNKTKVMCTLFKDKECKTPTFQIDRPYYDLLDHDSRPSVGGSAMSVKCAETPRDAPAQHLNDSLSPPFREYTPALPGDHCSTMEDCPPWVGFNTSYYCAADSTCQRSDYIPRDHNCEHDAECQDPYCARQNGGDGDQFRYDRQSFCAPTRFYEDLCTVTGPRDQCPAGTRCCLRNGESESRCVPEEECEESILDCKGPGEEVEEMMDCCSQKCVSYNRAGGTCL